MTIFDFLKDIVVHKTGSLPLDTYVPFLVNRWLSFINPEIGKAINQLNTKTLLENKSQHYKLMLTLFPRMKYVPKINYVKKVKEDKKEDDIKIKILAQNFEISEKEALLLMNGLD